MAEYCIISLKHTMPAHRYVTLWRPERAGYCWSLAWAGTYDQAGVVQAIDHDEEESFAVPRDLVVAIATKPRPGNTGVDDSIAVRRTAKNIQILKAARVSFRSAEAA